MRQQDHPHGKRGPSDGTPPQGGLHGRNKAPKHKLKTDQPAMTYKAAWNKLALLNTQDNRLIRFNDKAPNTMASHSTLTIYPTSIPILSTLDLTSDRIKKIRFHVQTRAEGRETEEDEEEGNWLSRCMRLCTKKKCGAEKTSIKIHCQCHPT